MMLNYTTKACAATGNWWDLWADVLGHRGNKV